MVHYKLMCFDVRGLGEVIRQLFYLGDVSFEDFRVSREEFKSLKSNLPSGQLPVLEIDGVMISQSASIGRFLARQYGYSGKTPTEEMQVDSIIDLFKDFMLTFRQFFFAVIHGYPEYEKISVHLASCSNCLCLLSHFILFFEFLHFIVKMVHYKLTYFNARGLAEISRQLFHMAGVEFEDERINEEKFSQLKPTFPSGQVPILCIDGAQFSQSTAIARYLARKFGFVGQTAEEELQADEVVDTFKDFIESFRKFVIAVLSGESEEILKNIREEVIKPAVKTYTAYLKAILEKSSSGYLVGNELTWADLVIADNLTTLINAELLDIENDKLLKEFREKIIETPKLKEWLAKRPETRF